MWGIETYKETGEFYKIGDGNWPKHEALFEPLSKDLETALEVFTKRYNNSDKYLPCEMAWRPEEDVRFFYVEEFTIKRDELGRLIHQEKKMAATLKRTDT